ncbi:transcriptional regulator [Bacteroidia bacterium]|nr:transcriptional regulator [Bacteroidia bacterium]
MEEALLKNASSVFKMPLIMMILNQENRFSENLPPQPKFQNVWESFYFPKHYHIEKKNHPEAIIYCVIKGHIDILINDLEKYAIYPKEMFIIPDNFSCEIKVLEPAYMMTCRIPIESLFSEQAIINELFPQNDDFQDGITKLPVKKTILHYLSLLSTCIKDGLNSDYFFELKRHEFFLLLLTYYKKEDLARFLYSIFSKNIQFKKNVMDNYRSVKNVQELAALANYSTSGFIKKFQKYFNESPYQWMQKQKAQQILKELRQGVKSLQEIANEYKFSSYQHFAGFCKTQLGFPPTEILKKNRIKKVN